MSLNLGFFYSGNSTCFGRSLPVIGRHLTEYVAVVITNHNIMFIYKYVQVKVASAKSHDPALSNIQIYVLLQLPKILLNLVDMLIQYITLQIYNTIT
jgi:hypothetical protein